jgi:hypothetical protein
VEIRIFKPLDRRTASAELWRGDKLLAEIFAEAGSKRILCVTQDCIDWEGLVEIAPRLTAMLDEADQQMREAREAIGEE